MQFLLLASLICAKESFQYTPIAVQKLNSTFPALDKYNQLVVEDLRIAELERIYLLRRENAMLDQLKMI